MVQTVWPVICLLTTIYGFPAELGCAGDDYYTEQILCHRAGFDWCLITCIPDLTITEIYFGKKATQ